MFSGQNSTNNSIVGQAKTLSPAKMVASQNLNSEFVPEVIEEEVSLNGGHSLQYYMLPNQEGPANSLAIPQTKLSVPVNEQAVIEFEYALMALQKIPPMSNPCLKRTMAVGPKKFIGSRPNQQIHRHTNKGIVYTEFDTLMRANSAK